eukprot:CAMPEP_0114498424 /NCGR_PEP_ID=MMETSP0109-20121206/6869_1 /TAXON_ID=29199 /ORGANISM="Chlorarachnion reptans, Strain CCCM449" /LENGTH=245 /DNA_ID=CAMNT_0001675909 /DNA_START=314 /DNA_END=1051 /DNA_ORIENTATION=-
MLDPNFLSIVRCVDEGKTDAIFSNDKNNGLVSQYVQAGRRIYTFPMFTEAFCGDLIKELDHFNQSKAPKGRPNSMNNYGVLMDEVGFTRELLDPLLFNYIRPLAKSFYPNEASCLSSFRAFTVEYSPGKDTELSAHYDDAEVTLNVCLGTNSFENGDLVFDGGVRGFPKQKSDDHRLRLKHKLGMACLHLGSHIHRALHVTKGRRVNMIMWCRNPHFRLSNGCALCRKKDQFRLEPDEKKREKIY